MLRLLIFLVGMLSTRRPGSGPASAGRARRGRHLVSPASAGAPAAALR